MNTVHPRTEELLVDEMLAISDLIATWLEMKASEEAQWKYSIWLNSEERQNKESLIGHRPWKSSRSTVRSEYHTLL